MYDDDWEDDGEEETKPRLFGFIQEDIGIVYEVEKAIKELLRRDDLTPLQIHQIAVALHALGRLPLPTLGVFLTLSMSYRSGGDMNYHDVHISETEFRLSAGGSVDSGCGSDSYGSIAFAVEVGGYRVCEDDYYAVSCWLDEFKSRVSDETDTFDVEDLGDDDAVDWNDKPSEDAWNLIEERWQSPFSF